MPWIDYALLISMGLRIQFIFLIILVFKHKIKNQLNLKK